MKTLHTAYRVRDLDRSLDFYGKVGFHEIGRVKIGDGSTSAMLNLPGDGDVVTLGRPTWSSIKARGGAHERVRADRPADCELGDWRGELVVRLRGIILGADPEIVEEWKWDTPVWSRRGMVCAVGAFKGAVKVNFFKGASLEDPDNLFNAGLDAKAPGRSTSIRATP